MKVYDGFAFFNELDLLQLRLETLDPIVDYFILVEATRTFQKEEKPLYFEEKKKHFEPFLHKIRHIVVDEYPGFFRKFRRPKPWDYDNHQKEFILQGLKDAQAEDRVIISDLDEIPRPAVLRQALDQEGVHVFQQRLYYYYLNYECTFLADAQPGGAQENLDGIGFWRGSVMMDYQQLKKLKTIKKARLQRDQQEGAIQLWPDAGWHFAYLGGVEKIIHKLESYAHDEHNTEAYKDPERIKKRIREGSSIHNESRFEPVPLDERFPAYLRAHPDAFADFLYPVD